MMRTEADLTEAGAVSRRVEIVLGATPTTDSSSPSPSDSPVPNNDGLELGCGGSSRRDELPEGELEEEEDDVVPLDDVIGVEDSDRGGTGAAAAAARWGKGVMAIEPGEEAGKAPALCADDTTDPLGLRNEVSNERSELSDIATDAGDGEGCSWDDSYEWSVSLSPAHSKGLDGLLIEGGGEVCGSSSSRLAAGDPALLLVIAEGLAWTGLGVVAGMGSDKEEL